ncbi:MAG: hypothetical protein M5U19_20600 [Microthrixaceae bacterium]|nr:hypothetical protein [Microthrixaceae bacterium]
MPEHSLHSLHRLGVEQTRKQAREGAGGFGGPTGRADPRSVDRLGNPRPEHPEDAQKPPTRLWLHSAALAAVLVALLVLIDPSSIVVPDEGLYMAQADALAEGELVGTAPRSGRR